MIKKQKQYSSEFKAKVALAAKYEVHPTMITNWKRELTRPQDELK